jgi:hypothetical protein
MTGGCLCQRAGKTGVPNPRGYCLVCGELVAPVAPVAAPAFPFATARARTEAEKDREGARARRRERARARRQRRVRT